MGGGSVVRQRKRRFLQGDPESSGRKKKCAEARELVRAFGKYELFRVERGKYELIKGGVVVGTFSDAQVDRERVLFPLSRGMLLEVSENGVRDIIAPEKAMLMGLIASDGSYGFRRTVHSRGKGYRTDYRTEFWSEDKELIDVFNNLVERTYAKIPHHYVDKRDNTISSRVYSKEVFYDLNGFELKPEPYEFNVPRGHLDEEGKRAFLKGFFSGDGCVCKSKKKKDDVKVWFYSKSKRGTEELHQTLKDLGFHPFEIKRRKTPEGRMFYGFMISAKEHIKFIEEIGSYKPRHMQIFEKMRRKKTRGGRKE